MRFARLAESGQVAFYVSEEYRNADARKPLGQDLQRADLGGACLARASLREADRYSVNMLLYWTMLTFGIENGYGVFDFGRTTPESGT